MSSFTNDKRFTAARSTRATRAASARPPGYVPPTPGEFRKLHEALVSQLPELVPGWWRRVRHATQSGHADTLTLLRAEAESRLHHESRRRRGAILDVLFRLLELMLPGVRIT